ncbi:MAG: hypothetical protein GY821_15095, partial [Gammaproteobacteria bacterium]|nr:hypothetical protein [Gammaproteobacteria bacterium]
ICHSVKTCLSPVFLSGVERQLSQHKLVVIAVEAAHAKSLDRLDLFSLHKGANFSNKALKRPTVDHQFKNNRSILRVVLILERIFLEHPLSRKALVEPVMVVGGKS